MRKAALVLGLLLVSAMARAQSPDPDSDEAGLAMQVAKTEDTIKTSSLLIRDQGLNTYVRDVACRLAAKACPSLRIYIVETPGENATALPNGALVIWSGTLLRMENESQLAHLLAHEIAHYLHKDSVSQFHRMLDSNGLLAVFGVAASGIGMGFMGTPTSMAALSVRYAHSESEEEYADRSGFGLATDAGYDPHAAESLWHNADPDYLRQHPRTDARLAALHAMAGQIPARAVWNTGVEVYQGAVTPYLERWVDEELRGGTDNVALFLRLSASGRGIFLYGLGEAYRKRGRPADDVLATQAFRAALAAPDPQPLAWRGLGLVAMQKGDKAAARIAFGQYRAALPFADDRAMTDYYLSQP
ncbi:MAG TPA: M48 family metalloprotease [Rhizomicrobium sp.]